MTPTTGGRKDRGWIGGQREGREGADCQQRVEQGGWLAHGLDMSESIASKENGIPKARAGSAASRAAALHGLVRDALNRQMQLHPAPRAWMDAESRSKGEAAPEGA